MTSRIQYNNSGSLENYTYTYIYTHCVCVSTRSQCQNKKSNWEKQLNKDEKHTLSVSFYVTPFSFWSVPKIVSPYSNIWRLDSMYNYIDFQTIKNKNTEHSEKLLDSLVDYLIQYTHVTCRNVETSHSDYDTVKRWSFRVSVMNSNCMTRSSTFHLVRYGWTFHQEKL